MKIDILTLFPSMFDGFLENSIIKRAIASSKVEINIINIRDYSKDPHKKVDDYAFGGGAGMVLRVDVLHDAIEALRSGEETVILLTPQGKAYKQSVAYELKNHKHIILVCGHYEGFDERILSFVDMELSIGDYILTGGEIPAMVISDSIVRLVDGVILEESHLKETFQDNLLDYPVYTKPVSYLGMDVPEVLLSGNHKKIDEFRQNARVEKTKKNRPDLLERDDSCA